MLSPSTTPVDPSKSPQLLSGIMDEDGLLISDTPSESGELSGFDKQRASLQTYLNSLPYQCEAVDEMQQKLEHIVGMMYICAKAKNWLVLSTWDGMLQWLTLYHNLHDLALTK
jgi:proteasome activator subunit 4